MALLDRFRAIVIQILRVEETPHRLALAFSVGLFVTMTPFVGLHTITALLVAWAFRLNKVATVSGALVNNPWSMIPIYTFCTWVGTLIMNTELRVDDIDWQKITLGTLVRDLEKLIVPLIVGCAVVGLIAAVLSYVIVRKAAESYKETP